MVDLGRPVADLAAGAMPWRADALAAPAPHGLDRNLEPLGDLGFGNRIAAFCSCSMTAPRIDTRYRLRQDR
jgi:hypothetical protein